MKANNKEVKEFTHDDLIDLDNETVSEKLIDQLYENKFVFEVKKSGYSANVGKNCCCVGLEDEKGKFWIMLYYR
jgi:hypothetical protein